MPKALIEKMKAGYSGSGLPEPEVNQRIYGHLNNIGAMKGSKETSKGATLEAKFERDHTISKAKKKATARSKARLYLSARRGK